MPPSIDAYDTPWKEAVSHYFPEFMAFYFPQAHAAIDWGLPYLFLDKELAQAHLLTQKSRRDTTARGAAKWRLARLLYQRNWDKQRIIDLFSIIDWMMRLPADLEAELWRDIQEWERSDSMPYVTSVERIGLKRGLELGREEGRQEGQTFLLARQLTKRFGPLPEHIQQRLARASAAQLETWAEAILDASKLSDVFG